MKKIVSMFVAMAVVFGMGLAAVGAAESKPIAAFTVASYDDLVSDVNFIGGLVERPQLGSGLEGLLAVVTQGKGLVGVDKSRPWGAIVQVADHDMLTGYAFLPVTDFDKALDLAKLYCTVEADGEVYKLTPKNGPGPAYVKQLGNWALIAMTKDVLADIKAEPVGLLGKLKKGYIIGGRIFLANVPATMREKFVRQLHQGIAAAAEKQGDESDAETAGRKKVLDQMEPYLTRVLGDLNQVVFGWGLDQTEGKTFIDLSVTALPDTKTAEELGMAAKLTTNFAGFRAPNAAINAAVAALIPEAKQEIAASMIEAGRTKGLAEMEKHAASDATAAAMKDSLNDGADLLQKIVKSGHVDGAATVHITPDSATILLGGYVADGALLDKILHTLAAATIKEHPEVAQFVKLDAETVGDIHYHKISVQPPPTPDAKKMAQLIGENADVVIGVGKESAYVGAGRDADAKLKKAITDSAGAGPTAVKPVEVSLAVKPMAEFVTVAGEPQQRPQALMVVTELDKAAGKDHVTLVLRPISNGVQFHLEVEQGLLRLFGRLVVMQMNQGGG